MSFSIEDLETGDIILYDTRWWYSRLIEYFSKSKYSHISIVLKRPIWLDEKLTEDYYILESGAEKFPDAETGEMICGVQIAPFRIVYDQYKNQGYGQLYVRKLDTNIDMNELQDKIRHAYLNVKAKPYDLNPLDWLKAYDEVNKDLENNPELTKKYQKTNTFWCSALVSYVYVNCGLLDKNIPWTIVSPSDYCYKYRELPLINCKLEEDKLLI